MLRLHADCAHRLPSRPPLLAHPLQRAHPPLVPGGSRLHPPADPRLLLREPLVETRPLRAFGRKVRLPALEVRVVIARPVAESPAIEFHDPRRQFPEEHPVVGYEEERPRLTKQKGLEPGDGVDVQVVGGLVEEKDVRVLGKRPGDQRPALHPPGKGAEIGAGRKAQAGDRLLRRPSGTAGDDFVHGPRKTGRDLLGDEGDLDPLLPDDLAFVRRDLPAHDPQQGGFPGPVPAQEADPIPRLDLQARPVEKRRSAEGDPDVPQAQQRHAACSVS